MPEPTLQPIRIRLAKMPGDARIEIGGVDVARYVRSISVFAHVEGVTVVRLELIAGVEFDEDAARVLVSASQEDV